MTGETRYPGEGNVLWLLASLRSNLIRKPRALADHGRRAFLIAWSLASRRPFAAAAWAAAAATVALSGCLLFAIYLDRSNLPDLEPFLRFEPPATGRIYDERGNVLIELANEYREIVTYDEIPSIVRDAL